MAQDLVQDARCTRTVGLFVLDTRVAMRIGCGLVIADTGHGVEAVVRLNGLRDIDLPMCCIMRRDTSTEAQARGHPECLSCLRRPSHVLSYKQKLTVQLQELPIIMLGCINFSAPPRRWHVR